MSLVWTRSFSILVNHTCCARETQHPLILPPPPYITAMSNAYMKLRKQQEAVESTLHTALQTSLCLEVNVLSLKQCQTGEAKLSSPLLVMWLSPLSCWCSPWFLSPSTVLSRFGKMGILGMAWQRDRRRHSSLSILGSQHKQTGWRGGGEMPKSCRFAHVNNTLTCIGMLRIRDWRMSQTQSSLTWHGRTVGRQVSELIRGLSAADRR